ncbi:MAG: hypothetical protein J6A73_06095 [Lachnospiraceae bacterium]|nr:hypothetical protein [Lachnospiraceae bacterium]
MKRAQITVYLTLVFTLILSVFLSAFEAARGSHLKIRMENAVQTAIHSTFGEYHRELFERYGLLFIDTSYMSETPDYRKVEERLEEYLEYNLKPGEEQTLLFARDWYGVEDYNVSLTNIRLATDDWGDVFRQQAVDYMQNYVGGEVIEEVYKWLVIVEEYELDSGSFEEYHKEAVRKEKSWQENNLLGEEWNASGILPSLDFANEYLDVLSTQTIGSNFGGISTKAFIPWTHASHRWNIQGTEVLEEQNFDLTKELFFGEYILDKFGNYTEVREDSKLDYQVEYILFGQSQDSLNYVRMMEALFWFRGTANLCMLLADKETQATIELISQLSLLLEIPPEVVIAIINVCWAAAESMSDVQKLTKGEKVPLLKGPQDFTIGLGGLMEGIDMDISAKGGKGNIPAIELEYEDYLRIFLYLQVPVLKVYRCMDMIEADIRLTEGNENFRMDACADAISLEVGIVDGYGHFYSMERKYSYF